MKDPIKENEFLDSIAAGIVVWIAVLMIWGALILYTRHCAQFMPLPYEQVPVECMRMLIVR